MEVVAEALSLRSNNSKGEALYCVHEECTYTPGASPLAIVLRSESDAQEDAIEREETVREERRAARARQADAADKRS